MTIVTQALPFFAKFLLVSYFLSAGYNNIQNPAGILGLIKMKRIPMAKLALVGVFAVQILGSLMVLFNIYPTIGALSLIAFTLASNLLFCNFWTMHGMQKKLTGFLFSANVAVIGGLLFVVISNAR